MRISRRTRGPLLLFLFAFAFAFSVANELATAGLDCHCNCYVYCGPQQEYIIGTRLYCYYPPSSCILDLTHCDNCVAE
jgi:hypothetical protein